MTPSNANTSGLAPCPFCGGEAWLNDYDAKYSDLPPMSRSPQCRSCGASLGYLTTPAKATEAWNRRVTAASAQAAIDAEKAKVAELEAERDQISGESLWWKAVIGDGEYKPSGEVPSIKHLHPAMVKPVYDAHKGTAVADVIAGLIFSRAITENREQFLVGYANARATAAEARADRLADIVKLLDECIWFNPDTQNFEVHHDGSVEKARAALQQETQP